MAKVNKHLNGRVLTAEHRELRRDLSNRHIQLISIGGCIGTGLFMGSGRSIASSGPSILLVYAIIGIMLYFVMRAIGELLLADLRYKSFVDCAEDLLGPWAGFATGWSYWLAWIITAMAELVAITGYMSFWWPEMPGWTTVPIAVAGLLSINLLTVRLFGEVEFWFALIKIIAIVSLISVGCWMTATAFPAPSGYTASLSNLWRYGGIFPAGWEGILSGFQTAIFAFVGMEIIGTTAAEVKDPKVVMPRAINAIPLRILLFYLGTLTTLMMVTPWSAISAEESPFVGMFILTGLKASASVVNFIAVSSALSSINSGIYSTSRMLYGLSKHGDASVAFSVLSSRGVPVSALLFIGLLLLLPAGLLALDASMMDIFQGVAAAASLLFLCVWSMLLLCYLSFRRRRPELHDRSIFPMPFGQFMSKVVLGFFAFILVLLTLDASGRWMVVLIPSWFGLLALVYFGWVRRQPGHKMRRGRHRVRTIRELR